MVMDLNKCIGCQTCTIACKRLWARDEGMDYMWWNSVNTQPGRGTPRDWEQMGGGFRDGVAQASRIPTRREFGEAWEFNHEEVFFGGKGNEEHLRVKGEAPDWGPNWDEDQGAGEYPNAYYFYHIRKLSQKCILCFPRVEQGVAPACARMCPGRVRFVGYRDDPNGPIWKLVEKWQGGPPPHPEDGTEPNVFYVPPIAPPRFDENGELDETRPRIPDEYLISLFG